MSATEFRHYIWEGLTRRIGSDWQGPGRIPANAQELELGEELVGASCGQNYFESVFDRRGRRKDRSIKAIIRI